MRAKKIDANQKKIVEQLRKCGYSVQSLASIGKGTPDILVGTNIGSGGGRNYLFEIKDGSKTPSQRKLTPDEVKWIENWRGQVNVVTNIDEILKIING